MGEKQRRIKNCGKRAETRRKRKDPSPEGLEKTAIMCQSDLRPPASAVSAVTHRYFWGLVCRSYRFWSFFSAELTLNLVLCNRAWAGWQYTRLPHCHSFQPFCRWASGLITLSVRGFRQRASGNKVLLSLCYPFCLLWSKSKL